MDAGKTYVTFVAVVFMSYNCLFYFNKTNIGVLASLLLQTCDYNLCIAKKRFKPLFSQQISTTSCYGQTVIG